jgi:PTS system nitrogen regulatory IIA component
MERENKMSTGMENGIAIPHGKTGAVKQLAVAIARKKEGVDFNSMDKKPAKIFIMTISPSNQSGPHLQFLAEVSKLLRDSQARKKLLEARSADEVLKIFL